MKQTLWVSPNAAWGLKNLSKFIKKHNCGEPTSIQQLISKADPQLIGQIWIVLNSYDPSTDTYKAFSRFISESAGSTGGGQSVKTSSMQNTQK